MTRLVSLLLNFAMETTITGVFPNIYVMRIRSTVTFAK